MTLSLIASGFLVCMALIVALRPLLQRYALARPNARSSHTVPTPQGGGIAVIGGVATALALAGSPLAFSWLMASILAIALLGAIDDLRPLPVLVRLIVQTLCIATVLILTGGPRLFPALPYGVELLLLTIAGLWFVNLTNFMDGLDGMSVAEMAPLCAFSAWFLLRLGDPVAAGLALALLGALIGFAPFNKPVARLFLGDVGSLPIGLIAAWLLYRLAGQGALVAALLLPLYYLADATITLLLRLKRKEKVWQAHRSHFYQRATDRGFSALQVSSLVFALNLALGGLAFAALPMPNTAPWDNLAAQALPLALGAALTAALLWLFGRRA